jgi:hypothetical protein
MPFYIVYNPLQYVTMTQTSRTAPCHGATRMPGPRLGCEAHLTAAPPDAFAEPVAACPCPQTRRAHLRLAMALAWGTMDSCSGQAPRYQSRQPGASVEQLLYKASRYSCRAQAGSGRRSASGIELGAVELREFFPWADRRAVWAGGGATNSATKSQGKTNRSPVLEKFRRYLYGFDH